MEREECTRCGKCFNKLNSTDIPNQNMYNSSDKECQKYFTKIDSESNISESDEFENNSIARSINRRDSGVALSNEIFNNSARLKSDTDTNAYGKIKVDNSQSVIVGNVTYVTGPVYITQISSHIKEENITNQLLINDLVTDLETIKLNIISRENWMAQPAKKVTALPEKSQYVIIAHTATEDGYTQPQNALLVKLIQTFHIESRGWNDLAYNFLVGCDGNIYEGRGWNIEGAHTYGYNRKSICIAFIGCFMDHLPPVCALTAARKLILEGVKLGFIPEDYILVGHCQCSPIESPGVQLFNEIKQWPRWRELTPKDTKY